MKSKTLAYAILYLVALTEMSVVNIFCNTSKITVNVMDDRRLDMGKPLLQFLK